MKIHAHILAYNEEKILPFTLDYYSTFCEKIYIYDNMSTDGSDEIYARYPNVKVIKWNSNNEINETYYVQIKSNGYKELSRDADWVIVCDCDEILYHPNLLEKLAYYKEIGVDMPETDGRDMASEKFPEYDGRLITEIVQIGSDLYEPMCKNIVFNPKKDIVFGIGAHSTFCKDCVRSSDRVLKLLHYKFLGEEYVNKIFSERLARLSEFNLKNGFGAHYKNPDIGYLKKMISENKNVVLDQNKNMKKIETFIFVHDQKIILDFIGMNKFSEFENFKYVFLGNKPCDLVENLSNVIIARNLEHNIEVYPKLTSFTGWYALYKNNLINSEYVNFFEYDINYVDEFPEINKELIKSNYDFIGYFPMPLVDPVYLDMSQYTDSLVNSINLKTGVNVHSLINKILTEKPNSIWSSSSNSTWKVSTLNEYINWFVNFIDDIKTNQYCGHMHERSISFYYYIFNKNVKITNGLMTHFQLNSHGTSPLPLERGEQLYKMLK